MTNKPAIPKDTNKKADVSHPGMMGDGTEEQNLNERGNPRRPVSKRMRWMPPSASRAPRSRGGAFGNSSPAWTDAGPAASVFRWEPPASFRKPRGQYKTDHSQNSKGSTEVPARWCRRHECVRPRTRSPRINRMSGIRVAATALPQSASVETSSSMPLRA